MHQRRFCLSSCSSLPHHGLSRSHTWPRTLTTPLHATTLHSHLLPAHIPAPRSHLYFGYKTACPGRTPGLVPTVAKDSVTLHIPTRLGKVYKRALVVPPSSPHQRPFVCGACIGTAQVGVLLVSLLNPLVKRSRLHCFDICLAWYLRYLKIWWQHLVPTYRVSQHPGTPPYPNWHVTCRVCFVKHMMISIQVRHHTHFDLTTWRACFVKHMMIMRQYFPRLWYDPYQWLGLYVCTFCLCHWRPVCAVLAGALSMSSWASPQ